VGQKTSRTLPSAALDETLSRMRGYG